MTTTRKINVKVTIKGYDTCENGKKNRLFALYKYDEIRKEWVFARDGLTLSEVKFVADAFHYVSVFEAGV